MKKTHNSYWIETYGCQMNVAESNALELSLEQYGLIKAESDETADCVIINTCSVRKTAENRIWGRIGHYKHLKDTRDITLIITGCMAERLHDEIIDMAPAVDYVVGTNDKHRIGAILTGASDERKSEYTFTHSHYKKGEIRSYVPIMNGCNNFCAYCIVPYVRGREISRSVDSILEEISSLEQKGVREITLLGQNVNSYSFTHQGKLFRFPDLLDTITSQNRGIHWYRYESPHPKDFSSDLIQLISERDAIPNHVHLPLQSGSSAVLQAMGRKYSREGYLELVSEMKSRVNGITFTSDVMVGFPGETEQDFQDTISLMNEVKFIESFMYYFNPREGTKAVSMENQIPINERMRRLKLLIENQRKLSREHKASNAHGIEDVIVEGVSKKDASMLLSHTAHDEMVVFTPKGSLLPGTVVQVEKTGITGNTYTGVQI